MVNHETFSQNTEGTLEERPKRFDYDPEQWTEEEIKEDPSRQFGIDPAKFKIFAQQADKWNGKQYARPVDETASRFVTCTADTIAAIAGEGEGKKLPAADHVIYLDKSARPVSWLVGVFWDKFTDKKRPKHQYLNIDRIDWLREVGADVDDDGYVLDVDGTTKRRAHFGDFERAFDKIPEEAKKKLFAQLRGLFIPGGIQNEDVDEIMDTPTGLEGKNITIVDEVGWSGTTMDIAKFLIGNAIPEAASVNGYLFWNANADDSTPVWYDEHSVRGRGVGNPSKAYRDSQFEKYPNPLTRARRFGHKLISAPFRTPDASSLQLMQEIVALREEYEKGHILPRSPKEYNNKKWREFVTGHGIEFIRQDSLGPYERMPARAYSQVVKEIDNRDTIWTGHLAEPWRQQ